MMKTILKSDHYDGRSIRDNLTLVGWIFAWMATYTLADKAALYGWWSNHWITFAAFTLNLLMGIGLITIFMRMLRRMDDLQRKIQLDAMAMALGVSMVGCISYSLLVTWGYIIDEEVSDIFMLMCVSYSASVLIGAVRYR